MFVIGNIATFVARGTTILVHCSQSNAAITSCLHQNLDCDICRVCFTVFADWLGRCAEEQRQQHDASQLRYAGVVTHMLDMRGRTGCGGGNKKAA